MKSKLIPHIFLLLSILFTPLITSADESTEPASSISESAQVNINTANAELLAKTLKGIGLKKAQAIIAYRESYGPFHDIYELEAVKGIGKSTLAKNEALIIVE